jgi:hypothetical protein
MSKKANVGRDEGAREAQSSYDRNGSGNARQGTGWEFNQPLSGLRKENADLRRQVIDLALEIQAGREKLRHALLHD